MARPKKCFDGSEGKEARAAAKERGHKLFVVKGKSLASGRTGVRFYFVDETRPRPSQIRKGWTVEELATGRK